MKHLKMPTDINRPLSKCGHLYIKSKQCFFFIFRVEYISENIFACFLTFLCKNNAKKQILFENWGIYCSIRA